jgi:hypothetical protein
MIQRESNFMTIERSEAQIEAQGEVDQHYAEQQQALRELFEWIGLPLICFNRSCRRSRLCTQEPSGESFGLPCLAHYREEVRFILHGPDELAKNLLNSGLLREECEPIRPPKKTLIEVLYGNDPDSLRRLRRPKGVKGPGCWVEDPAGFARYMEAGDWRNPEGVARRPPVSYYGRIVA